MTLLQTQMEELAATLQYAEREAGCVRYGDKQFGMADYWTQPRVFERLAGNLVRNAGSEQCVFGARALMLENEHGTMIRPPVEDPEGEEFEAIWLLAIDLVKGIEIGLVRRTPNGWGALRICADQIQLQPEAPGYWLMQEMLREE